MRSATLRLFLSLLLITSVTGCALFTKTEYRYRTTVVEIPEDFTQPETPVKPPEAETLLRMDRLELIDQIIDLYDASTEKIVNGNQKLYRIRSFSDEQAEILQQE